ncbi:hypothetical protein [Chloroflexus sp.]|uniref:hypothetical protein n=1 Tax=Chloroflexus sp. TaxID=1904827 RepID=UPI002ACDD77A|nr:hypothetical protein [Chloroflexus sp.]
MVQDRQGKKAEASVTDMKPREVQSVTERLRQMNVQSERLRLRTMLRMLNGLIVVLTIAALLIMLIPPLSHPLYYVIVVISLAINGLIDWFIRRDRERSGAILLVAWTNLGILLIIVGNMLEGDLLRMTIFAAIIPLFVIFAGLLLGWRLAGIVVISNLIAIFAAYIVLFATNPTQEHIFEDATGLFTPILPFSSGLLSLFTNGKFPRRITSSIKPGCN